MNSGIFSAIAAAFFYSCSNYIDKFLLEKQRLNYYLITIYSGIFGFIVGLGVALVVGIYTGDILTILLVVGSGFLINISLLPYYKTLSMDETSRIIPLFSVIPVFTIIMGYLLLGELLSGNQYIGSFFIIVASLVISMEKPSLNIFKLRKSFWYLMLSCFLYSLSLILYKFVANDIPFFQALTYEGVGVLLCSVVLLLNKSIRRMFVKNSKRIKKKVYGFIFINESINLVAVYFYWFSLTTISAGLASTIMQGIQPLITLFFGIVLTVLLPRLIKEDIGGTNLIWKASCIVVMFIGLYFIFLP